MVLKKLLQLFGVGKKKKDSKKKGKSIDPLWQGVVPHSTVNVLASKSILDPCSSGAGTVLSLQKHEPECSSIISTMINTIHGSENDDYKLFSQFDVVQDFSDHHYAKTSPGKATKDWTKAIQNEWKLLQRDLPGSIYVRVYEDRTDLLRAAIAGPSGTPYHDGLFFFDVRFPPDYPRCPPKVHYHSGGLRLNPNLYESGKVCLSLLNTWWGTGCEKWGKSKSTMLQVLISIQGLVLNDKPYFNEPGNKSTANTPPGEKHSVAYNQTAFVLSCKTMLYSLRKPPKHFENLVVRHFHERERAILDACGAYSSGMVVGSLATDGAKYACDKWFVSFKKSLDAHTELLAKELATNRTRALELDRDAPAADEIVSTS
ncbi:putative ubiquitin-conjugating enzyme E2 38 isoform X1 [Lolium rigidum]|uniref:putative ubiquitin-conjugating enzyme E2 38 isoform X1 n=1 Tax=Lolium rigidum TaxID=89674 RepID=UPI001F5D72C1|nr:putative ubiquitin-conjugating enzyme E2 38 isoform X1 [Lolium rigidum]XP_047059161.1 putative ubiquitin-conjugating enzyme E2 38 isoform X1 [Lolium rigidum]